MKKVFALVVATLLAASLLAGCGGSKYKDGEYTEKSSPDERGNYGEIKITVKDGKITAADYKGYLKDGKVKDQDYGKTNGKIENQENYDKAQKALVGAATYGPKLVETQEVSKVDAVSGATSSLEQFKDAAGKALAKAK